MNNYRAFLQTEGKLDYRDCLIAYYTYSRFESPHKYYVNVNIHMHLPSRQLKKTLALDDVFDNEAAAIEFGLNKGKQFIDQKHETNVTFLKLDTQEPVIKKEKMYLNKSNDSISKKERR